MFCSFIRICVWWPQRTSDFNYKSCCSYLLWGVLTRRKTLPIWFGRIIQSRVKVLLNETEDFFSCAAVLCTIDRQHLCVCTVHRKKRHHLSGYVCAVGGFWRHFLSLPESTHNLRAIESFLLIRSKQKTIKSWNKCWNLSVFSLALFVQCFLSQMVMFPYYFAVPSWERWKKHVRS